MKNLCQCLLGLFIALLLGSCQFFSSNPITGQSPPQTPGPRPVTATPLELGILFAAPDGEGEPAARPTPAAC
ncbi:hypothetical protein [Oceanithermus sp.]